MNDVLNLAATLLQANCRADAIRLLNDARMQEPDRADLIFGRAVIASEDRDFRTAIPLLERLCRLVPGDPAHWIRLSHALREARNAEAALQAATCATTLTPQDAGARSARGAAYHALGHIAAARMDLAAALAENPTRRADWINQSLVSTEASALGSARAEMRRALDLAPGRGDAEWGLALIHWLAGDLAAAWRSFDGRLLRPGIVRAEIAARPRWDGADFVGKTLLLWAEQGQGDTLQFIRYYDRIKAHGGRVVVEVQPSLKRLFARQSRFDAVYARGEPLEPFDLQMALMSAPVVFGTMVDSIPAPIPYLVPPGDVSIPARPGLKVGLVWRGNPDNATADRLRSFPLSTYAPLLDMPGVSFFALQMGREAAGRDDLVDLGAELTDFGVTADMVAGLDLLISSCTSVPHLAGAMGKPVWLLLNKASDYRWGLQGETTPWYPTFRLYRQQKLRDWSDPIRTVKTDLEILSRRPTAGD